MKNPFDISNKTVLITGSSGGLGFTFAQGLGSTGARIILNGRDPVKLEKARKTLMKEGISVSTCVFDITKPAQIKRGLRRLRKEVKVIDVLVNNAGINLRGPLETITDKTWREVMAVNLDGLFYVSREVVPEMIKKKQGKVINIASLMSEAARPSTGPYTASKGGVKLLTKAMAAEWGRHNIQVNAVGPGYFLTDMTRKLAQNRTFDRWVKQKTPAGRWGQPGELLGAVQFFASAASDFVNGQILYVDGGFLSQL